MRLPFVPRGTFDLLRADLAKAEEREARWVERYDALLVRLDDLTRKTVAEPPILKERTRDEVIDAIMTRAGSNGMIRAALSSYAATARRNQVPNDEIVQNILVWREPNDDDPSAGVP
jgi:hypothetical protein